MVISYTIRFWPWLIGLWCHFAVHFKGGSRPSIRSRVVKHYLFLRENAETRPVSSAPQFSVASKSLGLKILKILAVPTSTWILPPRMGICGFTVPSSLTCHPGALHMSKCPSSKSADLDPLLKRTCDGICWPIFFLSYPLLMLIPTFPCLSPLQKPYSSDLHPA